MPTQRCRTGQATLKNVRRRTGVKLRAALRTPQRPRTKLSTRLPDKLQALEISRETLHQWVKRSFQTSVPVHVKTWPRGSYIVSGGPLNSELGGSKGSKQAETFFLCAITLDGRDIHEGTNLKFYLDGILVPLLVTWHIAMPSSVAGLLNRGTSLYTSWVFSRCIKKAVPAGACGI